MVLGIMSDKEIKGIMRPLLPLASEIIVTAPSYSRASSPEQSFRYRGIAGLSECQDCADRERRP